MTTNRFTMGCQFRESLQSNRSRVCSMFGGSASSLRSTQ